MFQDLDLDQENLCPSLYRATPDPVDYEYLDRIHNKYEIAFRLFNPFNPSEKVANKLSSKISL